MREVGISGVGEREGKMICSTSPSDEASWEDSEGGC